MTNQKIFMSMALAMVLASPISGFSAEPSPPPARGVGQRLDHGVLSVTSTSTSTTPPARGVGQRLDHGVLLQVTGDAARGLYDAIQDPIEDYEGFRRGENITCAITPDGAICEMEMSGRGVFSPAR